MFYTYRRVKMNFDKTDVGTYWTLVPIIAILMLVITIYYYTGY